jgi:hypothetical protein
LFLVSGFRFEGFEEFEEFEGFEEFDGFEGFERFQCSNGHQAIERRRHLNAKQLNAAGI